MEAARWPREVRRGEKVYDYRAFPLLGDRGGVRVATIAEGDQVHLDKSDDGVGFAPADAEKLFEPLYTTKPVGKGTGLGLFIPAGIAEKHRGNLRLNSRPGRGTEARLTLSAFT